MPTRRSTSPEPGKRKKPAPAKKQAAKRTPAAKPSPPAAKKTAAPKARTTQAQKAAAGATERLMQARPAADPSRADSPLTLAEEAFITEYLRNGENGTAAWIFAHPGTAPSLAAIYAHRLLRKGKVSDRVNAERARLTRKHEIDRDSLLQELLLIVRADPNELTQMRQVACGHCFNGVGGRGNALYVEPDPDCEVCAGEGVSVPWYADTRKLSAQARALFAGVKTTKDGAQVLMHDKMAALDRIARIIGAYKEDNDQKAQPVADAIRAFFGQIHGDRLPIAKTESQPAAAPNHPLVGSK